MHKQSIAPILVAVSALCGAGAAHALDAGAWLVKVGVNKIMPKVQSGDLSAPALPNSTIGLKSASSLFFTAAYMVTDHVSVELLAGLPYKHDIYGTGAVSGVGKLGSVHQVSPTVLLQYRFLPSQSPLRPYIGVGPTLAHFYDSRGSAQLTAITNPGGSPTTIGSNTRWGITGEGGVNYKINDRWFLDAAILKTMIETHTTLSTQQTLNARLNPVALNASIGYRF